MGVLQMAIPGVGLLPRGTDRASDRASDRAGRMAAVRQPLPGTRSVQTAKLDATPNDGRGTRGRLQPSANARPGATLARSPEQEAAQELLVKLVHQCLAGDQHAWQQLVVSQHRRIYAICYRFTGSASDAEDLTQDVFLKLYRNLASFDTQKGSFQTWITTLARNLLVDHFRRTRLDRATDSLDASLSSEDDGPTMADRLADTRPSQEQHASGLELKVRIQAALKQLSPELREAVILRDLEDMDYKEIAQVLRIPEGTVKSRISRGRGELARLLERIEGQVM
jgi:RNA polymerase sigma-70 factor, ECF subfamily